MTALTVWKFDDADGASRVAKKLDEMSKQELISIHDAAIVSWEKGKKKPKTQQAYPTTALGATGGAFWGLLFGTIFLVPLFGTILGAAFGAVAGALSDFGIDDDFINSVKQKVVPGTSALFLLSSDAVLDKIKDGLGDEKFELLTSNLDKMSEESLADLMDS